MPGEETAQAVAQSLLGSALNLRRNETVIIETWTHCLPYATACVVEARRRGARPILLYEDEGAYWRSVESGNKNWSWAKVGAHEWAALSRTDAYVFFPGPADSPRLDSLPKDTRDRLLGYNNEWYERARRARIRGVRSVLGYVSDERARFWVISIGPWRDSLERATISVDYNQVSREAKKIAARLTKGKELHVSAANGTDMRLKLRGRRAYVDDGRIDEEDVRRGRNLAVSPPGTVAVALDEGSAEGMAIANRPTFQSWGRLEGGQWEFNRGRLTSHWYTDGASRFDEKFAAAPKGKDVVSMFSLGLHPELDPGIPPVEDQEAGAVTLAIGGNTFYGGTNRVPFLSYLVIGEATVALDGKPLCDRGKLLA